MKTPDDNDPHSLNGRAFVRPGADVHRRNGGHRTGRFSNPKRNKTVADGLKALFDEVDRRLPND